jgi:hypothetical protein
MCIVCNLNCCTQALGKGGHKHGTLIVAERRGGGQAMVAAVCNNCVHRTDPDELVKKKLDWIESAEAAAAAAAPRAGGDGAPAATAGGASLNAPAARALRIGLGRPKYLNIEPPPRAGKHGFEGTGAGPGRAFTVEGDVTVRGADLVDPRDGVTRLKLSIALAVSPTAEEALDTLLRNNQTGISSLLVASRDARLGEEGAIEALVDSINDAVVTRALFTAALDAKFEAERAPGGTREQGVKEAGWVWSERCTPDVPYTAGQVAKLAAARKAVATAIQNTLYRGEVAEAVNELVSLGVRLRAWRPHEIQEPPAPHQTQEGAGAAGGDLGPKGGREELEPREGGALGAGGDEAQEAKEAAAAAKEVPQEKGREEEEAPAAEELADPAAGEVADPPLEEAGTETERAVAAAVAAAPPVDDDEEGGPLRIPRPQRAKMGALGGST